MKISEKKPPIPASGIPDGINKASVVGICCEGRMVGGRVYGNRPWEDQRRRRQPMQSAVGGLAEHNFFVGSSKRIGCYGDSVEVTVGCEGKPRIAGADRGSACAGG